MRKSLLASIGILATLATTPAFAWSQKFHLHNATAINFSYPVLSINAITLTGAPHAFRFSPSVASGQWANFDYFKDAPCMRWVTIYPDFGLIAPFTAPNKFNVCTQTVITISDTNGPSLIPTYTFTYN